MKKLITSVAVASFAATSAFAGSLVEPEMEPMVEVMEEDTGSSSGGLLLPLLALVAIGVLISSNDSSDEET